MQTSGFFDAMDLGNGQYDREYVAAQFAKYFSLFVGNGVFLQTANALQVVSAGDMNIIMHAGAAFANGYWYLNDNDYTYAVPINTESTARYDSVVIAFDTVERTAEMRYKVNDISVVREDEIYELQIAQVVVNAGTIEITDAYIVDKRPDESVCGFVKGLVEVLTTNELFNQFNAQFVEWFDTIKGKLGEDAAGSLQLQIDDIKQQIEEMDFPIVSTFEEMLALPNYGEYLADAKTVGLFMQSFQDGCDEIEAGCTTYGATPASNSPSDIVEAIAKIYEDRYKAAMKGNATAAQVLSGKTFTNASSVGLTGTMTNRGAWTGATAGSGNVTIPAGYHNGSGYVSGKGAYDAGVTAGNDGVKGASAYTTTETSDSYIGSATVTLPKGTYHWYCFGYSENSTWPSGYRVTVGGSNKANVNKGYDGYFRGEGDFTLSANTTVTIYVKAYDGRGLITCYKTA